MQLDVAHHDARTPAQTASVLTARMGVRDANAAGDVHGGWIMKLCDDVAVIAALRLAQRRVVTVAVDGVRFRDRVSINDVLTLKATVNAAWRTSMEIGVRVEAEDVLASTVHHTLTAYVTLVALNERGVPSPVPPLRPETADERRRWQEAQVRRRIRLGGPPSAANLPIADREPDTALKAQAHDFAKRLAMHRALRPERTPPDPKRARAAI